MSNELFLAITNGDVDTVRRLVGEDPSLASARDGSGLPAVLLALFNQQREAADALLAQGARNILQSSRE
jgi:ankyrin repeat protein